MCPDKMVNKHWLLAPSPSSLMSIRTTAFLISVIVPKQIEKKNGTEYEVQN